MNDGISLFADVDLTRFIVPAIVIFFMIMGGILKALNRPKPLEQQRPMRRPPAQPRPGMQQPRPGMQQPGPRPQVAVRPQPPRPNPIADEVNQFLRRAVQQRMPQRAAPPPLPRPRRQEPAEVELLEPMPEDESVAGHVSQHLGSGKLAARLPSQLGDEVAQADDKMEEHVHQVFDHQLGRLAGTPGEAAGPVELEEPGPGGPSLPKLPPTAAAGLAAMLAHPQGVRQAILINEVLQRPEHRWS